MDEGGFILDYWMPAGSSLEETNRVLTGVEELMRDMPEVESTSRRTGLELGLIAVTEANTGDFRSQAQTGPQSQRGRGHGGTEGPGSLRSTRCSKLNLSSCCRT